MVRGLVLCLVAATAFDAARVCKSPRSLVSVASVAEGDSEFNKEETPRGGAVAAWHAQRKRAVTRAIGPETVERLRRATPVLTLSALVAADAAQLSLACSAADLGPWVSALAACTIGGWLSLVQFACLHDVLHGAADPPNWLGLTPKQRVKFRETALFVLSQPSVFGYWLYLDLGHLNHHANTGDYSARDVFDSSQRGFEDGDVFFVTHRQESARGPADDPRAISIARGVFRNFWRFEAEGAQKTNALAYSFSMVFERVALCANDKLVAVTGRNGIFFPNKPESFHEQCAQYARFAALAQLAVCLAARSPAPLAYLLLAETAWQLPFSPAAALFVSNHGVREGCDDAPTRSVYWPNAQPKLAQVYDALCANANYHLEHHDFPDVPFWNLPKLRRAAGEQFYPASPHPASVIADAFSTRVTYKTWSRDNLPEIIVSPE